MDQEGTEIEVTRYWLSWYQDGPDYRPLTFPPNEQILGWWRTGETGEDPPRFTLCAMVLAETEDGAWEVVRKDWPDMGKQRFIGLHIGPLSDRFPLSDWMQERMGGK